MCALFRARRVEADRRPEDGTENKNYLTHQYDTCRPAEQMVDFVGLRRKTLNANGLQDVGLGPGDKHTSIGSDRLRTQLPQMMLP
jgi:hypothetical protein